MSVPIIRSRIVENSYRVSQHSAQDPSLRLRFVLEDDERTRVARCSDERKRYVTRGWSARG